MSCVSQRVEAVRQTSPAEKAGQCLRGAKALRSLKKPLRLRDPECGGTLCLLAQALDKLFLQRHAGVPPSRSRSAAICRPIGQLCA